MKASASGRSSHYFTPHIERLDGIEKTLSVVENVMLHAERNALRVLDAASGTFHDWFVSQARPYFDGDQALADLASHLKAQHRNQVVSSFFWVSYLLLTML